MKLNNQKGFTLIELIMVIVIMGILAATVVPRFFDFTAEAEDARVEAIMGSLKSGLNLYAADNMVKGKGRSFPKPSLLVLTDLLDDVPTELSYTAGAETVDELTGVGTTTTDGAFTWNNGTTTTTILEYSWSKDANGKESATVTKPAS